MDAQRKSELISTISERFATKTRPDMGSDLVRKFLDAKSIMLTHRTEPGTASRCTRFIGNADAVRFGGFCSSAS